MNKCPKCNSLNTKESQFNSMNGFKAYRCQESYCNNLFELSNTINKDTPKYKIGDEVEITIGPSSSHIAKGKIERLVSAVPSDNEAMYYIKGNLPYPFEGTFGESYIINK